MIIQDHFKIPKYSKMVVKRSEVHYLKIINFKKILFKYNIDYLLTKIVCFF